MIVGTGPMHAYRDLENLVREKRKEESKMLVGLNG
jgi:hypothetical protein